MLTSTFTTNNQTGSFCRGSVHRYDAATELIEWQPWIPLLFQSSFRPTTNRNGCRKLYQHSMNISLELISNRKFWLWMMAARTVHRRWLPLPPGCCETLRIMERATPSARGCSKPPEAYASSWTLTCQFRPMKSGGCSSISKRATISSSDHEMFAERK